MSALARILADRAHPVTGSDPRDNATVRQLKELGVGVYPEQNATTIQAITASGQKPIVVVSSAIPETNEELVQARVAGLTIWHRSDLLAALIAEQPSIHPLDSHQLLSLVAVSLPPPPELRLELSQQPRPKRRCRGESGRP